MKNRYELDDSWHIRSEIKDSNMTKREVIFKSVMNFLEQVLNFIKKCLDWILYISAVYGIFYLLGWWRD
ncbi:MAG: hypothetical protein [Caudoviricetes sp.]|nr:MAG: hypothetical protein [Caudoviricetes sp.]